MESLNYAYMYKRLLQSQIFRKFFAGKVIIITGARQTGKTTLTGELVRSSGIGPSNVISFNCDNPTDRESLSNKDLNFLVGLIGKSTVVIIDEGQKVETIGQTAKLLVDHFKKSKQIIITGSSSFNLLDKTQEALTGRKSVYHLFPMSLEELHSEKGGLLNVRKELESYLVFGSYPEVVMTRSFDGKTELLKELTNSYLYQDILEFQQLKSSAVLLNLLKSLAFQIGQEVSYTELANLLGIDKNTVERYVDLLEKNYIIFRLPPYARNKRREISKLRKIYFCDLGIRNAIINNFNLLDTRDDVGALWENFMICERMKFRSYHKLHADQYFWRTYDGSEVDLIEERDGKLYGFEFTWSGKKKKQIPKKWMEYKGSSWEVVSKDEISGFVL